MALERRFRDVLPALCGGLVLGLSYPPTGPAFGFLAFIGLIPFLVALESTTRLKDAFKLAYVGTFVWNLIGTYWVGGWLATGNVDQFLMISGIALAFFHPLLLSIPFLIYDVIRRRFGAALALVTLPLVWIGFEYSRAVTDIAFPWVSLYNTQTYNLSYIQFIEFFGSYAISFFIVCVNAALYLLLRKRKVFSEGIAGKGLSLFLSKHVVAVAVSVLGVCIVLPYAYGIARINSETENANTVRVLVIQPNINPWAKWDLSSERIVDSMIRSTYTGLKQKGRADLVLWPETAITYPITVPSMREDLAGLSMFLASIKAPLLTGIPDKEYYRSGRDSVPPDAREAGGGEYYRAWNAAMLFERKPDGSLGYQRYHKQLLVPFGERVPFVDDLPFLGDLFKWGVGLGSWNREGVDSLLSLHYNGSNITAPNTANIAVLICYESVFPTYVQKSVSRGANVIAIVTNDGWYGNSSGPYQHERYAVLRAIENRRWVIRSANTGISCVIDDRGHIVEELPFDTNGAIARDIPMLSATTLYGSMGDFLPTTMMWVDLAMIVFFIVTGFRNKDRQPK